jgi:hypothetical protein
MGSKIGPTFALGSPLRKSGATRAMMTKAPMMARPMMAWGCVRMAVLIAPGRRGVESATLSSAAAPCVEALTSRPSGRA